MRKQLNSISNDKRVDRERDMNYLNGKKTKKSCKRSGRICEKNEEGGSPLMGGKKNFMPGRDQLHYFPPFQIRPLFPWREHFGWYNVRKNLFKKKKKK